MNKKNKPYVTTSLAGLALSVGEINSSENNYWFITFSDLMSLMVAFFVMLYAMSSPKQEGYKFVVESITQATPFDKKVVGKQASKMGLERSFAKRGVNIDYLEAVFSSKLEDEIFDGIVLNKYKNRLYISLMVEDFLDLRADKVRIYKGKERVIFEIADMLSNIKNQVKVIGVTSKVSKTNFDIDYEQALTFASSVSNMLKDKGYKDKLEIFTEGNSRLSDKFGGGGVLKVDYKNRVDIVIMADGQDL